MQNYNITKFLLSLSVLFLFSCWQVQVPPKDDELGTNPEIESIRASARTVLKEVKTLQAKADSLTANFTAKNTGGHSIAEPMKRIATHKRVLEAAGEEASRAYETVRSAVNQAEDAVDDAGIEVAKANALSAKNRVDEARNRAKQALDNIQAITGS